ncbi:hypothetical protein [Nitrosomonas nitrosa]|nr:hypothetical protein [Nitrosomonas nitrosa]
MNYQPPYTITPAIVNLVAAISVESLIFEHQAQYYQALQESTR